MKYSTSLLLLLSPLGGYAVKSNGKECAARSKKDNIIHGVTHIVPGFEYLVHDIQHLVHDIQYSLRKFQYFVHEFQHSLRKFQHFVHEFQHSGQLLLIDIVVNVAASKRDHRERIHVFCVPKPDRLPLHPLPTGLPNRNSSRLPG
ncbi:hypothetical protein NX059_009340 [Plenodomus lindquistii]|nr:hypothetical protein NX059_009340 [Plenodomus lindquistii]